MYQQEWQIIWIIPNGHPFFENLFEKNIKEVWDIIAGNQSEDGQSCSKTSLSNYCMIPFFESLNDETGYHTDKRGLHYAKTVVVD